MVAESSLMRVRKQEVDVGELLKKRRLSDAEHEGVFLAQGDREKLAEVKWMVVAKLLTVKAFSESSLMSSTRAAWGPARQVSFCPIGKNLFVVQANCLGVWKKIMEEGPWISKVCALMLEEYDGATAMLAVMPRKVPAWEKSALKNWRAPKRSAAGPNELHKLELSRTWQHRDN